jgi:hypothetical protein
VLSLKKSQRKTPARTLAVNFVGPSPNEHVPLGCAAWASVPCLRAARSVRHEMNTGVPLGPGTYRIQVGFAPALGGSIRAQTDALTQARQYRANQQRELLVIGTQESLNATAAAKTRYQVDFRCLRPGDPGLRRPTPEPVPNVVIEDRRHSE